MASCASIPPFAHQLVDCSLFLVPLDEGLSSGRPGACWLVSQAQGMGPCFRPLTLVITSGLGQGPLMVPHSPASAPSPGGGWAVSPGPREDTPQHPLRPSSDVAPGGLWPVWGADGASGEGVGWWGALGCREYTPRTPGIQEPESVGVCLFFF